MTKSIKEKVLERLVKKVSGGIEAGSWDIFKSAHDLEAEEMELTIDLTLQEVKDLIEDLEQLKKRLGIENK